MNCIISPEPSSDAVSLYVWLTSFQIIAVALKTRSRPPKTSLLLESILTEKKSEKKKSPSTEMQPWNQLHPVKKEKEQSH